MSVDVIQPTSMLPMKRARESISLSEDNVSKCGELFVTNCADKWTFYCTYCQKATTDIGVFICHVRLEHLNEQQDLLQPSRPIPVLEGNVCTIIASSLQNAQNLDRSTTGTHVESSLPSEELAANTEQETVASHIVKEEPTMAISQENIDYEPICTTVSKIVDISSLTLPASNETDYDISNKISRDATTNPLEEQFAAEQQETIKTIQVVYINDEIINECQQPDKSETAAATLTANDDDNDDDNDKDDDDDEADGLSNVSGTNDNTEAEQKANRKASLRNGRIVFANKCEYCKRYLKSKDDLIKHIIRTHDKNYYKMFPYQCHKCTKGFKSPNGLKCHLRIHGSLVFRQCPLCPSNIRDTYFAIHLTKHESDTCFPCQVCGEIYTSHALRLQHWETHALEQPFGCNLCFRRYKKHQYLLKHLQSHQLYKCYFCKLEFDTPAAIIPPYICRDCEKLRLAKKKAKQLRHKLAVRQQQEDNQETQQHESSQPKDLIIFQSKTNNSATAVTTSEVFPTSANISNEESNTNFSYQTNNAANKHNLSKDVADLQSIDDNQPSSSSLNYTKQTITTGNKGPTLQYKCQDCKYTFTTKKALLKHMTKWHRKYKQTNLPFKCEHCKRSFQTKTGLSCHLKTHDKNSQFQCPICPLSVFRESLYVAHVMLHESETCFPCQVCAKIFATNEERVAHYQPHITERAFGCDVCYRRFYHHHFLRSHMKAHGVYFCNFCPQRFNSTEAIQKPYVCGNCEKLPDIKSTAEHQRSLKSKKHVFESDEEE